MWQYPFIQAIYKVDILGHLPRQYHIQRIEFPRIVPALRDEGLEVPQSLGAHVLYFTWRGYRGCVDVSRREAQTLLPVGAAGARA